MQRKESLDSTNFNFYTVINGCFFKNPPLQEIAIEAGTLELYYLNPSDKLWNMWKVIEHEDHLFLTLDLKAIGDLVLVHMNGKFIHIKVKKENKEKGAARFDHKDGMKKFCIEIYPHFLDLGIKGDDIKGWEGIARNYISKLTPIEIKRYAEMKNDPKPKVEEKSKGPYRYFSTQLKNLRRSRRVTLSEFC